MAGIYMTPFLMVVSLIAFAVMVVLIIVMLLLTREPVVDRNGPWLLTFAVMAVSAFLVGCMAGGYGLWLM